MVRTANTMPETRPACFNLFALSMSWHRFHGAILTFATAAIAAIGVLSLAGCGPKPAHDVVVAEINGVPLRRSQVEAALYRSYGALGLRALVDEAIVAQLARVKGIKADPQRVDALLTQEEMRAGSPKRLDERLAQEGRTREQLRAELAKQALAEQVLESDVRVTDAEAKAYYDQHQDEFNYGEMIKGRMILLDTRENAEAVASVLDEPGADFAGLARALSVDPGTKEQGGDMGWIERDDYAPEITEAAFKLKPGQHTGIIEYPDGFAIVLVEAKKPAGRRSFDEVRGSIESLLRSQKVAERRSTWAAEQRQKAQITVRDPALRKAFEAIRGKAG